MADCEHTQWFLEEGPKPKGAFKVYESEEMVATCIGCGSVGSFTVAGVDFAWTPQDTEEEDSGASSMGCGHTRQDTDIDGKKFCRSCGLVL